MRPFFLRENLIARNAEGVAGGGAAPAATPPAGDIRAAAALAADPPAAAPPATTDAPAAPPAATDTPWYSRLSKDVQDHIGGKGWKNLSADEALDAVANSYVSLERLFGADKAGNTLQIPKADATPEELRMFFAKAPGGIPDEPAGYELQIPEGIPESPAMAKAAEWFQKAGVPKSLAQEIFNQALADEANLAKEYEQTSTREWQDLQSEWGDRFEDQVELGRRGAKLAGWSKDQLAAVERVVGTKALMQTMAKIGANILEAQAPAPGQGAGSFRVTPQMAQEKIDALYKDAAWMAQYTSPNPAIRAKAIEEMENLTKITAAARPSAY